MRIWNLAGKVNAYKFFLTAGSVHFFTVIKGTIGQNKVPGVCIFILHSHNFNTKATVNLNVSIVVDYRYTNMRISNFAIKYLRKNEQISRQCS